MKHFSSPNFDVRGSVRVDTLVLHYTGMRTAEAALARLCDGSAEKKVSAHYVVDEDGAVYPLVDESMRAWHAGVSFWRGHTDTNARSIGIEIVNPGHEFGYREFPEQQMIAVERLCQEIVTRHTIPARNVVGHSDVAPGRKEDPGELFPWQRLAEKGVGLWPKASKEQAPMEKLAEYGYSLESPSAAVIAFQRHFRPYNLDGVWDAECAALLAGLLDQANSL